MTTETAPLRLDGWALILVVLAHPDTAWVTGNVIGVDGGEEIVG